MKTVSEAKMKEYSIWTMVWQYLTKETYKYFKIMLRCYVMSRHLVGRSQYFGGTHNLSLNDSTNVGTHLQHKILP
jgi:hypothetical protein